MGKCFKDMTPEECREIGRKGGIKSGEVRRAKRNMRENLDILLNMTLKSGAMTDIENIKSYAGLKGKNIDVQTAILLAQINKYVLQGDYSLPCRYRNSSRKIV